MNKKSNFEGITPDTLESAWEIFSVLIQGDEMQELMYGCTCFREAEKQTQKLFDELDKRTGGKYTDLIRTTQDAAMNERSKAESIVMIYGIYIAAKLGSIINRPAEFLEFLSSKTTPAAELYPIPEA